MRERWLIMLWWWASLILVGVSSVHHFGWEGLGIVGTVWLLAPQIRLD